MKARRTRPGVELRDRQADVVGAGDGDELNRLEGEHEELRQLFAELSSTTAAVTRKDLILRLMGVLAAHDDVEASAIGPVIRDRLVDGHRRSRSLRRHYRQIDRLLVEVERRSVFSPDMPQLLSATSHELEAMIEEQELIFERLSTTSTQPSSQPWARRWPGRGIMRRPGPIPTCPGAVPWPADHEP